MNKAQVFLDSLWPCGDQCFLANHTRTFLSAIIGNVPRATYDDLSGLAKALRDIADDLEAAK